MEAINITAYTSDNTQIDAIKSVLKALKIKFEVVAKEKPYNANFVAKVLEGDEDFKNGKSSKYSISEFKALCK
jgi:hypothetical protein